MSRGDVAPTTIQPAFKVPSPVPLHIVGERVRDIRLRDDAAPVPATDENRDRDERDETVDEREQPQPGDAAAKIQDERRTRAETVEHGSRKGLYNRTDGEEQPEQRRCDRRRDPLRRCEIRWIEGGKPCITNEAVT